MRKASRKEWERQIDEVFKAPGTAPIDDEKQKEHRTFTGWKLDLCRAVRADHKVTPGAASLFAAFMDHVNSDTKQAWPSEGMLALNLGASRPTVRKYVKILIDAKWLKVAGRSKKGTVIYLVQDYRMNTVLDQLTIEIERFRQREADRQLKRRQARVATRVCKPMVTPLPHMSVNTGFGVSVNTGLHEHLHRTPSSKLAYEEDANLYARFSNGE